MATTSDFSSASPLCTLPWDAGWVTAVAILNSGRRVVAGNEFGKMLLWDLPEKPGGAAPPPVRALVGHTNTVASLAVTPDDRWLISTSFDHSVRLWDLTEQPTATETVSLVAEGAAPKRGSKEKPTAPITLPVQQAAKVLALHKEWVRVISLSGDGKLALTGDDRGTAVLWNVPDGTEVRRIQVKGWLRAVAMSTDAKLAVTCEFTPRYAQFPNANRVWDLATGTMKLDLAKELPSKGESKQAGMAAAAVSRDNKLLAFGLGGEVSSGDGKIILLDAGTGKKVRELAGHQYGVTGLCFHPDGKTLASCGRDTVIRLWNVADGKMLKELGKPRGGQFKDWTHAISISADGARLAAADMAGAVAVWGLGV
jgi:WD40 repeat protein